MITGDKPNTAVSIGRSTGIIDAKTKNDQVLMLDMTDDHHDYDSLLRYIHHCETKIASCGRGSMGVSRSDDPFALCVTGNVFSFITTSSEMEATQGKSRSVQALLQLAMQVNSVIFCRVFPKQKVAASARLDV